MTSSRESTRHAILAFMGVVMENMNRSDALEVFRECGLVPSPDEPARSDSSAPSASGAADTGRHEQDKLNPAPAPQPPAAAAPAEGTPLVRNPMTVWPFKSVAAAPAEGLTADEVAEIVRLLALDHDGSEFVADCPACTAYQKLTAGKTIPAMADQQAPRREKLDAIRWQTLCANFGNEVDMSSPGKQHDILIRMRADGCEVLNSDGSLNFAATLAAIMDDEARIHAMADQQATGSPE